jgi:hypothetical protein
MIHRSIRTPGNATHTRNPEGRDESRLFAFGCTTAFGDPSAKFWSTTNACRRILLTLQSSARRYFHCAAKDRLGSTITIEPGASIEAAVEGTAALLAGEQPPLSERPEVWRMPAQRSDLRSSGRTIHGRPAVDESGEQGSKLLHFKRPGDRLMRSADGDNQLSDKIN